MTKAGATAHGRLWLTLWRPDLRRNGALATAMNAFSMFGYWGLFTWIPAYLSLPAAEGGRGLDLLKTTAWLVVMGVGKWLGYVCFGVAADAVGRRRAYVTYLLVAAALVPLYGMTSRPWMLLVLGPVVAFFGTGYFSGFAALTSELFPTEVRATAMGLTYNIGRGLSAFATATVVSRHYPRLAVPGFAAATYIAVSRLASNKHHLSDIVAGAGFGFGVGRAVVRRNGRPPDAPGTKDVNISLVADPGPSGDGTGFALQVVF